MPGHRVLIGLFGLLALCAYSAAAASPEVTKLFDGKTLKGWTIDERGRGRVAVKKGCIYMMMQKGKLSRIDWTEDFPRTNYELSLEVFWVKGSDDFCRVIFPVGEARSTYGMRGANLGLHTGKGQNTYSNTTGRNVRLSQRKWYKVRIRVTDERVQVWLSGKSIIDVPREDYQFGVDGYAPLALAAWETGAAYRSITLRRLDAK